MSEEALAVVKAAKMLGISRKDIQKKIRSGELKTFEGQVTLSQLQAAFPAAEKMETSSILEKINFIKDNAYLNRVQTAHIPDSYTLMGQVQRLRMELRMAREEKMANLRLIHALNSNLEAMQKDCDDKQKALVGNLLNMIARGSEQQK